MLQVILIKIFYKIITRWIAEDSFTMIVNKLKEINVFGLN